MQSVIIIAGAIVGAVIGVAYTWWMRACVAEAELNAERAENRLAKTISKWETFVEKLNALRDFQIQEAVSNWQSCHPEQPGVYIAVRIQKKAAGIGKLKPLAQYYLVCLNGRAPCFTGSVYEIVGENASVVKVVHQTAFGSTHEFNYWIPLLQFADPMKLPPPPSEES